WRVSGPPIRRPGGATAFVVRLDEAHHYRVETDGAGTVHVVARIGPLCHSVAERTVPPGPLTLRIDVTTDVTLPPSVTDPKAVAPPGLRIGGPDTLHLGYETAGGDFEVLAALDGRYLTTEVAGGFTGRVVGMYATRGSAAFDWFGLRPAA
ncbi:beta-xylosidase family glycoside hydrolase, partial [Streptomyces sp. OR43]